MKVYEAAATIAASPAAIWAVLTNAADYPVWHPIVQRIEGSITPGSTIKVLATISPGRAFPLTVTEFTPAQRMRWEGGMPLGLFKGVRTFTLTPKGEGVTEFTIREEFTGPLLPLMWRMMPDLGPTFQQFARDLKARAEQGQ